MRLEIAKALSDASGPVAMICGAWHVPALRRKVPLSEDRAVLKGLPKPKTISVNGVVITLVYFLLPFAILPIYGNLRAIRPATIEAAAA